MTGKWSFIRLWPERRKGGGVLLLWVNGLKWRIQKRFFGARRAKGDDSQSLALGREGEEEAARCLRRQGMRILKRNYTNGHYEIDIIAADGDVIVFVEVKTRQASPWQAPEKAVTAEKRRRIRIGARSFLRQFSRPGYEPPTRFDVVAIEGASPGRDRLTRHTRDAFTW